MRTLRRFAAPSALALALAGAVAAPAAAQDPDPAPPSVAQVCAATGVEQVDALLDGVARTDLVGALEPLASLTVPDTDQATIRADVALDDVRTALDCAESTTEPEPTTEPPATDDPSTEPPVTDEPGTDEPPATGPTDDGGLPVFYGDCADARLAGAAPITVGQPGYRSGLDSDSDGVACEDSDDESGAGSSGGVDTGDGVGPSVTPQGSIDTGAL